MITPPSSFTGYLFHGSPKRLGHVAFGEGTNTTPRIQPGRPFFVTAQFPYAARFARGGVVSKLAVSLERILDLSDEDHQQRLLAIFNSDPAILRTRGAWDEAFDGDIADSSYFLLESPEVMGLLVDEGFDGAFMREDLELGFYSFAILRAGCAELVSAQQMTVPTSPLAA